MAKLYRASTRRASVQRNTAQIRTNPKLANAGPAMQMNISAGTSARIANAADPFYSVTTGGAAGKGMATGAGRPGIVGGKLARGGKSAGFKTGGRGGRSR